MGIASASPRRLASFNGHPKRSPFGKTAGLSRPASGCTATPHDPRPHQPIRLSVSAMGEVLTAAKILARSKLNCNNNNTHANRRQQRTEQPAHWGRRMAAAISVPSGPNLANAAVPSCPIARRMCVHSKGRRLLGSSPQAGAERRRSTQRISPAVLLGSNHKSAA